MESAEKLSVTVTPAMARMIREKVEDGSFGSASEVIRAALRAFQREEEEHAERMASIRARVKASIEDTRPNLTGAEVRDRLQKFAEQYSSRVDDSAA
ncbi:type II toxin-antitoxin system ParD family antitoxin [Mesorhizobium sp. WSM4303]|uniref:type II toxin-antitoxin system ParD family antitoxin n=1 Tax=unclassified Mesorhizobium TaxID=325217 RepID=UPI00115DCEB7|nr:MULTISPECIES: type II toxin-antitoxin system ParD family antitoxin [unclassified Mesorhizobium]TRD00514.1 type II toxin-antitoxin system ParD family antitoxin [Mesorhizobium sp. WSM4306]TRD07542.1 type II toxin-antitoxin system ParD family antitoxin [Mesorhizobium sp. WSM4303]